MNKWLELVIGLIIFLLAIVLSILNIWGFGSSALIILKGGIIWGLLLVGLLLIILGISDLRQ